MASMRVFTPFVDKENVADNGFKKRLKSDGGNSLKNHVGKTFQSGVGPTPVRRALGIVNRSNIDVKKGLQQQKPQQKQFEKPTPHHKPLRQKVEKPKVTKQQPQPMTRELFATVNPAIQIYVDEIEKMPLPEQISTEESLWPVAECPATYIKELREWRAWPFCQAATDPEYSPTFLEDSDDEQDDMLPTITEHSSEDSYPDAFVNEGPASLTWEDLQMPTLDDLIQTTL